MVRVSRSAQERNAAIYGEVIANASTSVSLPRAQRANSDSNRPGKLADYRTAFRNVLKQLDLSTSRSKLLAIVANQRGAKDATSYEEIAYLGYPFSISETFQLRNTNATRPATTTASSHCRHTGFIFFSLGFIKSPLFLKLITCLHNVNISSVNEHAKYAILKQNKGFWGLFAPQSGHYRLIPGKFPL